MLMHSGRSCGPYQYIFYIDATNQRAVFQRGVKRSSGPISRIPGGNRVAVKVSVVQMGRVNDRIGQGRSVSRDELFIPLH